MQREDRRRLTILLVVVAVGVAPGRVAASHIRHGVAAVVRCGALGLYQVGPQGVTTATTQQRHTAGTIVTWPVAVLGGTLTLTGYGACSSGTTSGTFAVRRLFVGAPTPAPDHTGAASLVCPQHCTPWPPPTGLISATGTFAQDPLHAGDLSYVVVSSTMTLTRLGPAVEAPCAQGSACLPPIAITTTVAMTGVTGYLQRAGTPQSPTLTLSFLPPPVANPGTAPAALVLDGWRAMSSSPPPTVSR